ncbi:hypothetical protein BJ983_001370 [Actinomycetospora corticicola]|uniref:Uncharacterized protein n=1 Tax=Actinomycetospora corticicola TaxID=663602 RepID=A0A7Y9DTK9_9PSEU|nr:hypothetical protein [Actinomycetospora corticicola]
MQLPGPAGMPHVHLAERPADRMRPPRREVYAMQVSRPAGMPHVHLGKRG